MHCRQMCRGAYQQGHTMYINKKVTLQSLWMKCTVCRFNVLIEITMYCKIKRIIVIKRKIKKHRGDIGGRGKEKSTDELRQSFAEINQPVIIHWLSHISSSVLYRIQTLNMKNLYLLSAQIS